MKPIFLMTKDELEKIKLIEEDGCPLLTNEFSDCEECPMFLLDFDICLTLDAKDKASFVLKNSSVKEI